MIYDTPLEGQSDATVFLKILDTVKKTGENDGWRWFDNIVKLHMAKCYEEAMPAARVDEIMSTVSVMDSHSFPYEPMDKQGYIGVIRGLFANYSKAVSSKT